ncbi:hypothetical protein DMQ94_22680 [Klebsiella variicola]|nr:hypothetical protein DMQ94_22680 [Klebsiella variicola]
MRDLILQPSKSSIYSTKPLGNGKRQKNPRRNTGMTMVMKRSKRPKHRRQNRQQPLLHHRLMRQQANSGTSPQTHPLIRVLV